MSAIQAVSRNVKTMVDGTLRLTVDIHPIYANEAFSMFGMPDVPMALARLTVEASTHLAQEETIVQESKGRISGLALLAVQWCQDKNFQKWLGVSDAEYAKQVILNICGISSRKELMPDTDASSKFEELIRQPYMGFLSMEAF